MPSFTYHHISTLPRLHNIVWCRLPETSNEVKPGNEVRPALVRRSIRDNASGRSALEVCYGSVKLQTTERGHIDLIIQNSERLAQLDLPSAVRFDLGLTNRLPWAAEFFCPPAHSLYTVAGPLTEAEIERLRRKLANRGIRQAM